MLKVDTFRMHDQHRKANLEHDQWLADIDFWREEHSRAAGMLEAVKEAWDKAGSCTGRPRPADPTPSGPSSPP